MKKEDKRRRLANGVRGSVQGSLASPETNHLSSLHSERCSNFFRTLFLPFEISNNSFYGENLIALVFQANLSPRVVFLFFDKIPPYLRVSRNESMDCTMYTLVGCKSSTASDADVSSVRSFVS